MKYECCICHRPLDPERHIRSQHSLDRYCPVPEWEACSAQALGKFVKRELEQAKAKRKEAA